MFKPDAVSLRQFYATPLGLAMRGLIEAALRGVWPQAKGDALLGVGYATPYLESFLADATPAIVCMPAQQGAAYWPPTASNRVFLAHESELPLRENSVNRALLMHSVENSEQLSWMMEEVWRALTPGGRVLAIVPNRLGCWSRSARTPFGYGRPFSMMQLRDLMTDHHFAVTRCSSALFVPPVNLRFIWRIAPKMERLGKLLCPFLGGVLLVEAEKQVYAAVKQPVHARKSYPIPVASANPVLGMK